MDKGGHTLHSLHDWHRGLFEKLGWMLLAKHHGHSPKIQAYLYSVEQMLVVIADKAKLTESRDKVNDLMTMDANVRLLQGHAIKLLRGKSRT